MQYEIVEITPEFAQELLDHNYAQNRRIRKQYAEQLAIVMSEDRFKPDNGQTIVVGTDGTLYDGQHRLSAIVKSGKTYQMLVCWVDENVYQTIDGGSNRTAADFWDGRNKTIVAAIAKSLACVELGDLGIRSCMNGQLQTHSKIDRLKVIDYAYEHHDTIQAYADNGSSMRTEVRVGSGSIYGLFIGIVRFCNRQFNLDAFVRDFCKNAPASPTVTACKMCLMRGGASNKGTIDPIWVLGVLLDAYDHYCEGDGCVMLNGGKRRIAAYEGHIAERRYALRQGGRK